MKIHQIRKDQTIAHLYSYSGLHQFLDREGYDVGDKELALIERTCSNGEMYLLKINTGFSIIDFIITPDTE